MNLPIEAILAILAIELYRSLAIDAPRDLPPDWTLFILTAGWVVFQYALAAGLARRTRRRLRRARASTLEIYEDFRFRQIIHRAALVILTFVHIHLARWPNFAEVRLGLPEWSVADDLVTIAPFVLAQAAGWLGTYRTDRILSRRNWGRWEYLRFQARYSLALVMVPYLALKALDDSRALWPERLRSAFDSTPAAVAVFVLAFVAAAAFLPIFMKWLFGAHPMPEGPMKARLQDLCRQAGLSYRDILVWRMERARILNAGVMGVVSRWRYVLFSDALLDTLSPSEVEAVLAHEIGHTRHRHVLAYLVFTLGFLALAYNTLALFPAPFSREFLLGMPVVAVLVVIYFRVIFGYISRAFERQADLYAASLIGTPVPLILALEKIALMSGDVRELSSWRHHSVAERVRFLSRAGYDRSAMASYDRKARRMVRAMALAVAGLYLVFLKVALGDASSGPNAISLYRSRTEQAPWDEMAWVELAELEALAGDHDAALDSFRRALANRPRFKRALAGLEALPVDDAAKIGARAEALLEAGRLDEALALEARDDASRARLARIFADSAATEADPSARRKLLAAARDLSQP